MIISFVFFFYTLKLNTFDELKFLSRIYGGTILLSCDSDIFFAIYGLPCRVAGCLILNVGYIIVNQFRKMD